MRTCLLSLLFVAGLALFGASMLAALSAPAYAAPGSAWEWLPRLALIGLATAALSLSRLSGAR